GEHFALVGLFCGTVRNYDTGCGLALLIEALDDDTIMQRANLHIVSWTGKQAGDATAGAARKRVGKLKRRGGLALNLRECQGYANCAGFCSYFALRRRSTGLQTALTAATCPRRRTHRYHQAYNSIAPLQPRFTALVAFRFSSARTSARR